MFRSSPRHRLVLALSLLLLTFTPEGPFAVEGPLAAFGARTALNKKVVDTIRYRVAPAYQQGNPMAVLQTLAPLVARMNDDQLAAVDSLLAEQDAPPVAQLLVESRLTMVRQNLRRDLPKPQMGEILLAIPAIEGQIAEALAARSEHPALRDPLPAPTDFDAYEALFWKVHVLERRLDTAQVLAAYGQQLLGTKTRVNPRTLTDQQRAILKTDFDDPRRQVAQARRDLEERKVELRLQRFEFATNVIRDSQDLKQRFLAAYVADLDGELLTAFFNRDRANQKGPGGQNGPATLEGSAGRYGRPRLNEPGMAETVEAKAKAAREAAGDLVIKSRLFHTGLHWWLRGRYGKGPDGAGLLKSPLALRSPRAQFGLFMPRETPVPSDPLDASSYPVPEIERRHHYIWMFEYRKIQQNHSKNTQRGGSSKWTSKTTLSHFY